MLRPIFLLVSVRRCQKTAVSVEQRSLTISLWSRVEAVDDRWSVKHVNISKGRVWGPACLGPVFCLGSDMEVMSACLCALSVWRLLGPFTECSEVFFPPPISSFFLHGHGLHCTLDMIYDVSLHSSRPGVNMSDLGRRAAALHLMPISCKQQWGEALFWKMLLSFHRMRWTCGLCLLEQPLGMPRRVLAQRPLDDFLWDRLFPYERLCLVLNSTKDHA